MTLDYKGQPRDKGGRFTYGKLNGSGGKGSTSKSKSGKLAMSRVEKRRVSSGILTDHPNLRPGERADYFFGKYFYRFTVREPGSYQFYMRIKISGNENLLNKIARGQ